MEEKMKGLIGYFGLEDWWNGLGKELQNRIRDNYGAVGFGNSPDDLDRKSIGSTSMSKSNFFQAIGLDSYESMEDFNFRVSVLLLAIQVADTATDVHYSLFDLIDLYYKKRDVIPDALELCEKYCLMDMDVAKKFLTEEINDQVKTKILNDMDEVKLFRFNQAISRGEDPFDFFFRTGYNVERLSKSKDIFTPDIPAFKRLAIIYEKQGKYKEAIEVCKKAKSIGLGKDNDDYSKRIEKLKMKLEKNKS